MKSSHWIGAIIALISVTNVSAKTGAAIKFGKNLRNLKNFKKMKKIMSALQNGMMIATIIDEIGSASHGDTWDHGYFDHKFQLISANMKSVDTDMSTMSTYIEAQDKRIDHNYHNIIILNCVSFLLIASIMACIGVLIRRTKNSHVQKRMNGLLSAITSMRDETKQRLRIVRARDEMNKMDNDQAQLRNGRNAIVELEDMPRRCDA